MAVTVGIYTRQAGVWERVNGPDPQDGFTGTWVRKSGVWEKVGYAATNVSSVWSPIWVSIDGEISFGDMMAQDFDISPYSVTAGIQFRSNGQLWRDNNGSGFVFWSNWRQYDCGREYEIWFEYDSGQTATGAPTLDTWLNLTDPATDWTHYDSKSGTGFLFRHSYYTARVREKVSAPAGGNDAGEMHIFLEAET